MSTLSLVLPRPAVDPTVFDDAAAHLAGAVAVVAWGGTMPHGLLVHSVSVLSATPPRILFAVDKADAEHASLLMEQECGVSLLAGEDAAQADRFSRPREGAAPFAANQWTLHPESPPEFIDSLAYFAGFIDQKIDAGSHSLFILRVSAASARRRTPLVYFDRGFRTLQA